VVYLPVMYWHKFLGVTNETFPKNRREYEPQAIAVVPADLTN
jgi:predicted transposase YbfD/YdcC